MVRFSLFLKCNEHSHSLALGIEPRTLIKKLDLWEGELSKDISTKNIESLFPNADIYDHLLKIENGFSNLVIDTAINKIQEIHEDVIIREIENQNYYWLKCITKLVNGGRLISYPQNLIGLCKDLLKTIAENESFIPAPKTNKDILLRNCDRTMVKSTLKTICDDFCNRTRVITTKKFVYFTKVFDFILIMESRYGDITRNILEPVINNNECLELVLKKKRRICSSYKSIWRRFY